MGVDEFVVNGMQVNTKEITTDRKMRTILPLFYDIKGNSYFCKDLFDGYQGEIVQQLEEMLSKEFAKFDLLSNVNYKRKLLEDYITAMLQSKKMRRKFFNKAFKGVKNKGEQIENAEQEYIQLQPYIIASNINNILMSCNDYLYNYFMNISYIAPIRATAERYYRIQGLDVQEIDSRGENIPMMLNSMSTEESKVFTQWMEKNFGFFINTDSTEGHISVFINKKNERINIADTGFGYSQILPIIMILWKMNNSSKHLKKKEKINNSYQNISNKLIVVEQPELHLHPKMQIQLINTMIGILNHKNDDLKITCLLETHSEQIINHIGYLISTGVVKKEDVNILLVEQTEQYISEIIPTVYSDEGYLEDWPLDFFNGEEW